MPHDFSSMKPHAHFQRLLTSSQGQCILTVHEHLQQVGNQRLALRLLSESGSQPGGVGTNHQGPGSLQGSLLGGHAGEAAEEGHQGLLPRCNLLPGY